MTTTPTTSTPVFPGADIVLAGFTAEDLLARVPQAITDRAWLEAHAGESLRATKTSYCLGRTRLALQNAAAGEDYPGELASVLALVELVMADQVTFEIVTKAAAS